jgi:hypothetical protein
MDLRLARSYPKITCSPTKKNIKRLKGGDYLMDIGCFRGHDLRRLIADGLLQTGFTV